jgi:hypothetical protein
MKSLRFAPLLPHCEVRGVVKGCQFVEDNEQKQRPLFGVGDACGVGRYVEAMARRRDYLSPLCRAEALGMLGSLGKTKQKQDRNKTAQSTYRIHSRW